MLVHNYERFSLEIQLNIYQNISYFTVLVYNYRLVILCMYNFELCGAD